MLAANALWSLVRFADHLPTPKVASTALKCASVMLDHTDDEANGVSWAPVRVAAAHAVHQLLEVHFEDEDAVKPHLPELFPRILGTVEDNSSTACGEVSFRVLHKLTEVSSESVAPYIENVADRVIAGCTKVMSIEKARL